METIKKDWKLIKNEYEIMHSSVKELSASHHVGEELITTAIEEGKWERREIDEDNLEEIAAKLAAMETFHQSNLVPKFINLQGKMLTCCDTLLDAVKEIDDAPNLKIVSEVIEKHRPSIMGVKAQGAGSDNVMKILIANKVGGGADVGIAAIQITQTAGETNGIGSVEDMRSVN